MKKIVVVALMILILTPSVFSATAEEYQVDEFPEWAVTLRRGETLFFGSLPLTCALTSLTYSVAQNNGLSPLHSTEIGEIAVVVGSAAILSLTIAIADYLLGD